jgi:pSer/pThr/pTyr-binding forkhead associated (FHA) protein
MERLLDFIFGIAWWHWLLGMTALAGLYYVVAGQILPFLKGVHNEREEEQTRRREKQEKQQRQEAAQSREAERRKYLKTLPSGPVEEVDLPQARVRLRNRYYPVPRDAEIVFGTARGCAVQIMVRGVSRQHAKIRPEPRGYVLYDLLSDTGTLVEGKAIRSKLLENGDRFRLGPVEVLFEYATVPDA